MSSTKVTNMDTVLDRTFQIAEELIKQKVLIKEKTTEWIFTLGPMDIVHKHVDTKEHKISKCSHCCIIEDTDIHQCMTKVNEEIIKNETVTTTKTKNLVKRNHVSTLNDIKILHYYKN